MSAAGGGARPPSGNRRSRRRARRGRALLFLCAAAVLVAAILIPLLANRHGGAPVDRPADATPEAAATEGYASVFDELAALIAPQTEPLAPTGPPLALSLSTAWTSDNEIAITVDDCFKTGNVRRIMDLCDGLGVKVTFFPVAQAVKNDPSAWREAHERGFLIGNHTYSHNMKLKELPDEEIAREIQGLNWLVNQALGIEYPMRYLRTPGGNADSDPKVREIMTGLGYEYIAHWALSSTGTKAEDLPDRIRPGQVILFHATDADVEKLETVLPRLVELGFRPVTLDQLMGLEPKAAAG